MALATILHGKTLRPAPWGSGHGRGNIPVLESVRDSIMEALY